MYTTIESAEHAAQLAVGTIGWDGDGAPLGRDAAGWFVVGGGRIDDVTAHLPLNVPEAFAPGPIGYASPCETCMSARQAADRPEPAPPSALVDRVAELIRGEFPDKHPHSRVNVLRSELAAARVVTFLSAREMAGGGVEQDPEGPS